MSPSTLSRPSRDTRSQFETFARSGDQARTHTSEVPPSPGGAVQRVWQTAPNRSAKGMRETDALAQLLVSFTHDRMTSGRSQGQRSRQRERRSGMNPGLELPGRRRSSGPAAGGDPNAVAGRERSTAAAPGAHLGGLIGEGVADAPPLRASGIGAL